jgi:hypothetical protein
MLNIGFARLSSLTIVRFRGIVISSPDEVGISLRVIGFHLIHKLFNIRQVRHAHFFIPSSKCLTALPMNHNKKERKMLLFHSRGGDRHPVE